MGSEVTTVAAKAYQTTVCCRGLLCYLINYRITVNSTTAMMVMRLTSTMLMMMMITDCDPGSDDNDDCNLIS